MFQQWWWLLSICYCLAICLFSVCVQSMEKIQNQNQEQKKDKTLYNIFLVLVVIFDGAIWCDLIQREKVRERRKKN